MNPIHGHIHTSRARAKIQAWFKKLDKTKNQAAGKEILESELTRARLSAHNIEQCLERFNANTVDDLYVAIGAGDVRIMQVIHFLQQLQTPAEEVLPKPIRSRAKASSANNNEHIVVEGVGRLMSQIAGCCQPLPGDPIQGYITMGRGVSVHKRDCVQLNALLQQHPERSIEVNWASDLQENYQVVLDVLCANRDGIIRDITTVLANDKTGLLGLESHPLRDDQSARVRISIEVKNLNALARTMQKIKQVSGVLDVVRTGH